VALAAVLTLVPLLGVLSSVVLACGPIASVLSDLPALRLFGWLSAFAMISVRVVDRLIWCKLPPQADKRSE
jgi:hypothetical protein